MAQIEPLKPLGPANAYGHILSVAVLEDKKVAAFVYDVRKGKGIAVPKTRTERDRNLGFFRVEDMVGEARPVAREFWERVLWLDPSFVWRQWLLRLIRHVVRRVCGVDFPGLDAWHILGIERLIETSAQIIGRFVLVDLLEVPQPLNLPLSAVTKLESADTAPVLVAVIAPGAELEDVMVEVERQFGEITIESGSRLPAKAKETVWIRFCSRVLSRRHMISETNKNQTLAKLALRIWPDPVLGNDEISDEYRERVRRLADTIRQNTKHFEDWKRGLFKNLPDVEPLTDSEI